MGQYYSSCHIFFWRNALKGTRITLTVVILDFNTPKRYQSTNFNP